MMAHHLRPDNLIMVTSVPEQLRMLYADMPLKLAIMYNGDSDGIAMACQSNMKSIKQKTSKTNKKYWRWESPTTIINADLL